MKRVIVLGLWWLAAGWVTAAGEAPALTPDQAEKFRQVQVVGESDAKTARAQIDAMAGDRHPIFDVLRGDLLLAEQQLDGAIDAYVAALEKAPEYDQARFRLAHAYVAADKVDLVPAVLEPVLSAGRGTVEAYALLGRVWLMQRRPVSAETAFRQWLLHEGHSVDARMGLSQALIEQQRWREAGALADELVEEVPGRIDLWRLRASISAAEEPETTRAFEILETAKRLQVLQGADMADLGDQAAIAGLVDVAGGAYETAFASDAPTAEKPSVFRMIQAGELLWRSGDITGARRWLKQSEAQVENGSPEQLRFYRLGARLADTSGDRNASVGLWQQVLALDPLNGEAMIALSEGWRESDPDKARQWMKRASRQEAVRRQALLRLVEWAVEDGEWDMALATLREARAEQDHPGLRRYEEQLVMWIEQMTRP